MFYQYLLGQTLKLVGLWLRSVPFTHGQLYVAISRVGRPEALMFAVLKKNLDNIVFKEVLL